MSKLNEMILEFREDIGQSIEGLALLMQMDPEEYARLEKDWIPPDDTLQRLCALFEWNYQDIKRLADDGVRFNLALSLHAANDQKRIFFQRL